MAVQGIKGGGIGQVAIPTAEEALRQQYLTPISEIARRRAQNVAAGALPTTADVVGEVPEQFFQPDTKLGAIGNDFLIGLSNIGQFGTDLMRAPFEIGRIAYEGAGELGSGLGEVLKQPTERRMKEIIEQEGPGVEADLSPFREAVRRQGQQAPELISMEDPYSETLIKLEKDLTQKRPAALGDPYDEIASATTESSTAAGALDDTTDKPYDPYGGMIEKQMRVIEALKGNDPDAKNTEDYMKEFAEATGVSIDGKADKSQALMAFGLALMQNKAGKGFDVSKALSALGEAGTAAAPAFQKAKDTARANRIAAGKYGLQQVAKDATARASSLSAAQGRLSELMQTNIDAQTKRELKGMEHNNAIQLKILEHQATSAKAASEGKYDFKNVKQIDDKGLPGLKTTVGIRETDGQSIFVYPEDEIGVFGGALADVNEGTNALAEMRYLISSNMSKPGGTSLQRAKGFLEGATRSFGFNMDQEPIFEKRKNDDGEMVEVFVGYNDKAVLAGDLQKADAIRDRVIAQFKRFLTQETGNGISNVDIKNVENLLGQIDFGGDPSIALARIDEAMNIFTSKREKLNSRLQIYTDQSRYRNEKSYQDSMGILRSSAASAYGLDTSGFTGVQMVKDDETGLDVIKLS